MNVWFEINRFAEPETNCPWRARVTVGLPTDDRGRAVSFLLSFHFLPGNPTWLSASLLLGLARHKEQPDISSSSEERDVGLFFYSSASGSGDKTVGLLTR